jgi:hypothetical protein
MKDKMRKENALLIINLLIKIRNIELVKVKQNQKLASVLIKDLKITAIIRLHNLKKLLIKIVVNNKLIIISKILIKTIMIN